LFDNCIELVVGVVNLVVELNTRFHTAVEVVVEWHREPLETAAELVQKTEQNKLDCFAGILDIVVVELEHVVVDTLSAVFVEPAECTAVEVHTVVLAAAAAVVVMHSMAEPEIGLVVIAVGID